MRRCLIAGHFNFSVRTMSKLEFLMSRVEFDPNAGCWLWTGWMGARGYGKVYVSGGSGPTTGAHRLSMILHGQAVPDESVVMHKCDTPSCINPDHLRVGTQAENNADKMAKGRFVSVRGKTWKCAPGCRAKEKHPMWGRRIEHCKRGHAFSEANTIWRKSGGRKCRACVRMTENAARRKAKDNV